MGRESRGLTNRTCASTGASSRKSCAFMGVWSRRANGGDYAIDFLSERAVFSVYRHASQTPLYTIEKQPEFRSRQGEYVVFEASGHLLKRGRDLVHVLRLFDRKLFRALEGAEGADQILVMARERDPRS